MTPNKISLKNFRKIPAVEIDLTGISLASIVGANGYGKSSTFAYAPLFALFGKPAPGCSLDDMVRTGQQDMSVTFEFEHNREVYQVIRTRSTKGKGKSSCEFQKQITTGWQSLSGTTMRETDAKIEALLSLDANTFCASSLILQGDAANFTKKLPGERKSVLSQILGLEIYDRLQSLAKEKEKAMSVKLEASKQTLERLSEELKNLPYYEGKLESIQQIIALTSIDIRTKETELSEIQAVIKDLEAKRLETKQIEKQIDTLIQEMDDKQLEMTTFEEKIVIANDVLESEPYITAKVAELEQIKPQIPVMEAKEARLKELQTEEKRLSKDETTLADEQAELAKRITALIVDLRKKDELKLASEQYQQGLVGLKGLDEKAEQAQAIRDQMTALEKQTDASADLLSELKNQIRLLQSEKDTCQKKVEILINSGCIAPADAHCKFLADAQKARQRIPVIDEEITNLEMQWAEQNNTREPMLEQVRTFYQQWEVLKYDKAVHATLKKQSEALRKQADLYTSLSGKEELLQTVQQQHKQLDERIFAINDQVLAMQRDIKTLQAETESLPNLKASIPSLELYVKQKDKFPEAKATIQSAKDAIAKLETEIATKNEQRKALQNDYLRLSHRLEPEFKLTKEHEGEVQHAIKNLQIGLNNLYVDQGTYQAKLDELNKAQAEHDRLKTELAPTAKELVRWQTLIKAYGKSGIPALIIENSIPDLELISNDILSQMTNGQNSLRFDPLRDKKDGKGQIETLDIWVNDDSGYERIYETYSGGEALRIDLAIRLGLAELLANRAGSKVEFVVGDELFGSQDKGHTELVIQALKAIAPRFKKVLIITHIETAQAMFDQQIVMSEGGRVEIQFN